MRKNIHITIIFSLLLALPLWTGCNNEMEGVDSSNSSNGGDYSGEPIRIEASVGSISNFGGTTTRSTGNMKNTFVQPLNENQDTGFDFVTTIEDIPAIETRANVAIPNVKFRMIAYKDGGVKVTNFAGLGDYQTDASGAATAIAGKELYLPAGTYTFICYSYGNNDDLPTFDSENITLPVQHYQDFMTYTVNNVKVADIADGGFKLENINFVRQCARIRLIVSVDGFVDNKISQCAVTLQNMNDATVNWILGSEDVISLPNTGTSGKVNILWAADKLNNKSVRSDSVIVLPTSERDLSALFTALTIDGQDLKNSVITIPEQTLDPHKDYSITISIERNYILAGGYKWAKGNVYKKDNEFFLEATQDGYHGDNGIDGSTYFGWNTLDATDGACNKGNYDYNSDPCSKIKPLGTWITPSRVETKALVDSGYDYDGHGAWMGEGTIKVYFPGAGMRINDGISPSEGVYYDGTFGYYSLRDNTPGYNQTFIVWEEVDWQGEIQRPYGLPIRCVKRQL
ncbi:hypothetical protein [Bacteroides sp.]|uniref:hypothetical protein n=1 Tax=Bacteroides sp. TaxID=29523 RepID=UPI002A81B65B|nr:hypothetical protein [Bacteroides sp.]